ncbi:hypothetical protein V6N11_045515 [Hibiscus sabdariffa]|uniref:PHD finger protein ALFIN-LIKE n=1 Tax=Hibiscus sabdariffa TaxID=183260 RepID=A0ABR2Q160_9ROSI
MASSSPRTVEEIFKDYSARRSGLVRALTYDVDDFYSQCGPDKENLCLYGFPNEAWEVALPAEEVPPELPEPALVSFYFGARLNRNERKRLFSMINDLPTVFEVVTGRIPIKDKPTVEGGSKSRNSTKRSIDGQPRSNPKLANENYEEDEEEQGDTFCGSCGGGYNSDEFWIGCDNCERCHSFFFSSTSLPSTDITSFFSFFPLLSHTAFRACWGCAVVQKVNLFPQISQWKVSYRSKKLLLYVISPFCSNGLPPMIWWPLNLK